MRRDALATSGVLSPTPSQKSLMPPPVPVDSTTGAGKAEVCAKRSATVVEKGNTVEEPTIWMGCCWALAAPIEAAAVTTSAAALGRKRVVKDNLPVLC